VTEMFPYLAVILLGVVVGLAELASTFADYPTDAIVSAWGLGLIVLNGAMAAIVLAVVRLYANATNLFLLVLAVGVGFQALIRTEFTLAKQFSGEGGGDLSLNLGWLYDQFQALCKTQIDQSLMRRRQPIVRELVEAFPSKLALFNMAYYTLVARRTLAPEEEARQVTQLTKRLEDSSLPDDVVRRMLALHILETGGDEHARALIEAAAAEPRRATVARVPDREDITRELAERLDLQSLKGMALGVVEREAAGEMRDTWRSYVEGTAGDEASAEAVRRTTLARFIVDKTDPASAADMLVSALEERPTP
ncbi:MAG: hypothetical protein KGY78_11720, partial [Anaerolineae bacterium]|nr:hypothetical protein [Anaerolineae bacterium]